MRTGNAGCSRSILEGKGAQRVHNQLDRLRSHPRTDDRNQTKPDVRTYQAILASSRRTGQEAVIFCHRFLAAFLGNEPPKSFFPLCVACSLVIEALAWLAIELSSFACLIRMRGWMAGRKKEAGKEERKAKSQACRPTTKR